MPSWLSDLVGADMAPLAYYALVAAIVLALIVIVLSIAKKALGGGSGPNVKGRGPRLAVLDVSAIDPKRKLVLVRRDEVEHLLLIGGQNDLVVEASILRGPAVGRQSRVEPSLVAAPEYAAGPDSRPAPSRPAVAPVARGASPLTRPVPRAPEPPAPAAAPVPPPVVAPPVAPVVAPPVATAPPVVAPVPDRVEPAVEAVRPAPPAVARPVVASPAAPPMAVAPPVEAPSLGSSSSTERRVEPEMKSVKAVSAPTVESPAASEAPIRRDAAPAVSIESPAPVAPPVVAPAPSPAAVQPAAAPPAPAPVVSPPKADALPPVRAPQIPPSALPRPIAREPERPVPTGAPAEPEESKKPVPPVPPRFSVGGTLEPVQRSGPPAPVPPLQQRSMATPTYPARSNPASAELDAKVGRPEPDTAQRASAGSDRAQKVGDEPSPEEVLARLLAKAKEPVHAASATSPVQTPPSADPREALQPAAPIASSAPQPTIEDTSESGERRPLSVRSFASAIQGRQAAGETAAPPQPPQPARRDPETADPATLAPSPAEPAKAPAAPGRQPATSWEDEEDDLEDFLSAQLNEQLGEDIWSAKDAPAEPSAPEPEPPTAPTVPTEAPAVEAVTRPAPDEIRPPISIPAKRPLTLEEEMERLLGDFDLETSDRRSR